MKHCWNRNALKKKEGEKRKDVGKKKDRG